MRDQLKAHIAAVVEGLRHLDVDSAADLIAEVADDLAVAVEALEKIAEGWTAAADDDTGELVEVRMSEDEMGETARAALAQIKGNE